MLSFGVACQAVALYWGHLLHAGHELSEIREMQIILLLLTYAAWMYHKISSAKHDEARVVDAPRFSRFVLGKAQFAPGQEASRLFQTP